MQPYTDIFAQKVCFLMIFCRLLALLPKNNIIYHFTTNLVIETL